MEKDCLYCGQSFDGAAQARFCSEAHRKAYARTLEKEGGLTPSQEQALRDDLGYSETERRTKAERDLAAQRMLERTRFSPQEQELLDRMIARLRAQEDEHRRKVRAAVQARLAQR
jgi:hypothetical protein